MRDFRWRAIYAQFPGRFAGDLSFSGFYFARLQYGRSNGSLRTQKFSKGIVAEDRTPCSGYDC